MPNANLDRGPRTQIYFLSGFIFASTIVAISIYPGLLPSLWADLALVVATGTLIGLASARWGDGAWLWLSDSFLWKWFF
jgi:hypothetical protein